MRSTATGDALRRNPFPCQPVARRPHGRLTDFRTETEVGALPVDDHVLAEAGEARSDQDDPLVPNDRIGQHHGRAGRIDRVAGQLRPGAAVRRDPDRRRVSRLADRHQTPTACNDVMHDLDPAPSEHTLVVADAAPVDAVG